MTPTYRALCAELVRTSELPSPTEFFELRHRARAALAAQPEPVAPPMPMPGDAEGLAEVFWGRYEQPEPVAPTDEELIRRLHEINNPTPQPVAEGLTDQELLRCAKIATPCYDLKMWERELRIMRAAIAADRARRPTPQPPVDGEVAELVEWLRAGAPLSFNESWRPRLTRAADLLLQDQHLLGLCAKELNCLMEQRQRPQPVAVSERPWERDGWCDEQGRCWWTANKPGPLPPVWWMVSIPQSCTDGIMLPANVLATPEDTND